MSNLSPNVPFKNKISVMHMPNESAAPFVAWVPVSGNTILSSSLSAYTPPKGVWLNTPTAYKLFPFVSNIPGSVSAVTIEAVVAGYVEGAFNRVLLSNDAEVGALTSAYWVW